MIDLRLPPFDNVRHERSIVDCWGNTIIPGDLVYHVTGSSSNTHVNVAFVKALISRDKAGKRITTPTWSGTPSVNVVVRKLATLGYSDTMVNAGADKDSTIKNFKRLIKINDLTLQRVLATIGVDPNDVEM